MAGCGDGLDITDAISGSEWDRRKIKGYDLKLYPLERQRESRICLETRKCRVRREVTVVHFFTHRLAARYFMIWWFENAEVKAVSGRTD